MLTFPNVFAMRILLKRAVQECTAEKQIADALRSGVFERAVKLVALALKRASRVKRGSGEGSLCHLAEHGSCHLHSSIF